MFVIPLIAVALNYSKEKKSNLLNLIATFHKYALVYFECYFSKPNTTKFKNFSSPSHVESYIDVAPRCLLFYSQFSNLCFLPFCWAPELYPALLTTQMCWGQGSKNLNALYFQWSDFNYCKF